MTTWSQWQENIYSSIEGYETGSPETKRALLLFQYLKSLKCPIKVLDLGCGYGGTTDKMRKLGHQVTGVDFKKVVKIAKPRHPKTRFVAADLSKKFPSQKGCFDLVYAGNVLAHIPDDIQFLKECHRVLKPEGVLILATPNRCSLQERVFYLFGFQQYNPVTSRDTQVHIYSFQSLKKLLQYCGFQPKALKGLTPLQEKAVWRKMFSYLERALPKTFRSEIWALAQKK